MKLQAHEKSDLDHVKTQNGKFDYDFISGQLYLFNSTRVLDSQCCKAALVYDCSRY
jgi:hypothetical protein